MGAKKSVEQHIGRSSSKKRPMIGERLDGGDQITVGVGLHDVGSHASLDDFANQLIGKMKSENQDLRLWKALANLSSSFQAIQIGHADVHYHHVRFQLLGQHYGLASCFRFGTNFPTGARGQQLLKTTPDNVVIVRYQNAQFVISYSHKKSDRKNLRKARSHVYGIARICPMDSCLHPIEKKYCLRCIGWTLFTHKQRA